MAAAMIPPVIASYFAAQNKHDTSAMLGCFSTDAVVNDEGRDRRGLAAIREWMAETTRQYRVRTEVLKGGGTPTTWTATVRLTGTFPGSPIEVPYRFSLKGGKIASLQID